MHASQNFLELLQLLRRTLQEEGENKKYINSSPEVSKRLLKWAPRVSKSSQEPHSLQRSPLPSNKKSPGPSSLSNFTAQPKLSSPKNPPLVKQESPRKQPSSPIEEKAAFLSLFPLDSPPVDPFDDLRNTLQQLFPNLHLYAAPPNDHAAKQIATQWMKSLDITDVLILSFHESPKEREFLENVAKAIEQVFVPAQVFSVPHAEKDVDWNTIFDASKVRLILANEKELHENSQLMQLHTKGPKGSCQFLAKIPLLILADLSLYLKDPPLKAALWQAIHTFFEQSSEIGS